MFFDIIVLKYLNMREGKYMLADQRKQIILDKININHCVTVAELVDILHVSTETVRRDLEDMENNELLVRVHGGAVSKKRRNRFEDIGKRNTENIELKEQIAKKALDYVEEGDVIAIDSGTTASAFALALKERNFSSLSVITYSTEVFSILSACSNYRITMVGGDYLPKEKIFYGFLTNEVMSKLYYSKAFVVPSALSLEDGAHDFIRESYESQSMLLSNANKVFILADSTKFETKGAFKLCNLLPDYTIITDDKLADSVYDLYSAHNLNVIR